MIKKIPPTGIGIVVKFDVLTGLRASEVIESVGLINNKEAFAKYYDSTRQTLEHFKFQAIFLGHTKKAYLSFVTPKMLELVQKKNDHYDSICTIPSYDSIGHIALEKESVWICVYAERFMRHIFINMVYLTL
jgi:hypothetical protein